MWSCCVDGTSVYSGVNTDLFPYRAAAVQTHLSSTTITAFRLQTCQLSLMAMQIIPHVFSQADDICLRLQCLVSVCVLKRGLEKLQVSHQHEI